MKPFSELIEEASGKIPLNMHIGTTFTNFDGVEIKITNIQLMEMHKSKPKVMVTYDYKHPDGHKGREDNYLEFFIKEITKKS